MSAQRRCRRLSASARRLHRTRPERHFRAAADRRLPGYCHGVPCRVVGGQSAVLIGNLCDNAAESTSQTTSTAVGVLRAAHLAVNMFVDECLERSAASVAEQR
jgi:hypothetical protein